MRNENIYKVYIYEAECNTFAKQHEYADGVGFAMGTSVKKALESAQDMANKTLKGFTPILQELVIFKGGKLLMVDGSGNPERTVETVRGRMAS